MNILALIAKGAVQFLAALFAYLRDRQLLQAGKASQRADDLRKRMDDVAKADRAADAVCNDLQRRDELRDRYQRD